MHKVVVTGGNGFIGSEICQQALGRGLRVSAVARHGRGGIREGWAERVEWVTANVLEPDAWRGALEGADALIHCVGIIREKPEQGVTFERINGDSTVVAAETAVAAGVESFVYLSAADIPLLPEAYTRAQRRAEREIAGKPIRATFLRPGLVYGPGRLASYVGAAPLLAAGAIPYVAALVHPVRPLPVDVVASAGLRAATDAGVSGVVDVNGIQRLGKEA